MLKIILNDPNRSDNVKCGEIFWHADTTYKATCFFCGEQLLFDDFPKHFQEHHIESNRIFTDTLEEFRTIKLDEVETENIEDNPTDNDAANIDCSNNTTTKKIKNQQNNEASNIDYPCKLCSRIYKRVSYLNQHIRVNHNNQNEFMTNQEINTQEIDLPFQCLHCPRSYTHKKNLVTHVQVTHATNISPGSNSKQIQEHHNSEETDIIFAQTLQEINTVNEVKNENIKCESTDAMCVNSIEEAVEVDDEKLMNIEDLQNTQGAILETSVLEATVINDIKNLNPDKEDENFESDASEFNGDWNNDDNDVDWSDNSSYTPLKKKKLNNRNTSEKDNADYPCMLCSRIYKRLTYLNQHIRVNHPDVKEISTDDKTNIQVDNLPFQCSQCPRSYRHKKSLIGHVRMHHTSKMVQETHKCDECGEIFREKRYLLTHILKHKGLTCDICGKKFTQVGNLQLHLKRHTGIKEFKCEECGKMFFTEHERNNHMVMHTQHFPSICEICGKPCRDGKLKSHMRRHTGERPAKCEVCGKCFFDTHDLNVHATSHSDERPFPCDICGSAFRHKKALRVHKKIHNKDRKHICKICGKSYAQAGGLSAHMRSHNTASKDDITTVLDEIEML